MVLLTKLCESVIKTLPENNSSNSYDYSENNLRLVSQSLEKLLGGSSNINDFESLINLIKNSISDNCKVRGSYQKFCTLTINFFIIHFTCIICHNNYKYLTLC